MKIVRIYNPTFPEDILAEFRVEDEFDPRQLKMECAPVPSSNLGRNYPLEWVEVPISTGA